jgi:NTE family protein
VFDDNPRRNSVVFAVQIWHTRSHEPDSIAQVFMRQKDILFGSRSHSHIARHAQLHRMRHVVRELYKMLPEERRNTPEAKALAAYGCATVMHLLEINARPIDGESNMRDFDFSKAAIHARWQAGYADARGMIARRPWENPVDPLIGVAVYASDPDVV